MAKKVKNFVLPNGEEIDISGANEDLSNLSSVGQAKLDAKANKDLSNLSSVGQAKLDAKANDSTVVHKTGNETIAGTKTFSSTISGSVNGSAEFLKYLGNHKEVASSSTASAPSTGMVKTSGLFLTGTYNDSATPVSYGNIINIAGSGTGQLLCEWSGADSRTGNVYYRSHRDTSTGGWGAWKKLAFQTDNVASATKATQDGNGNNIVNTYATKTSLNTKADSSLSNLTDAGKQVIKDNSGSGLEVGDIGMALYVDETKGLRRYLNGQVVDINENTQAFLDRLLQIQTTNPDYFTNEETWQSEATLNVDGCVYKFVLNYDSTGTNVVSVRLPKYPDYVEVSAGSSITTAPVTGFVKPTYDSGIVYLPRATLNPKWDGSYALTSNGKYGHFNMFAQDGSGDVSVRKTGSNSVYYVDAQADLSNLKLKNTKLKLRYFIQIATGSETENNIINDIELNNPYSLFECKYSDHELFNLSWLVSNDSYNGSNAVHPSAYQALLVEKNAEVEIGSTVTLPNGVKYTKQGLSVKLSTETYTDYDFVVNLADETFRLPVKPRNLNNTRYLIEAGEQDGTSWYRVYSDGWCEQGGDISSVNNNYTLTLLKTYRDLNYCGFITTKCNYADGNAGNTSFIPLTNSTAKLISGFVNGCPIQWQASGYLSDKEYTPLTDNILLYYYVGETVQNANLIDAGRLGEQLATKTDMLQASSAGMPSNRYIDLTLGASGSTYTAPANGYFAFGKRASAVGQFFNVIYVSPASIPHWSDVSSGIKNNILGHLVPVQKNQIIQISYNAGGDVTVCRFIYAEGSK